VTLWINGRSVAFAPDAGDSGYSTQIPGATRVFGCAVPLVDPVEPDSESSHGTSLNILSATGEPPASAPPGSLDAEHHGRTAARD
jgi:hypothetical protein